ncbi:hypothetical protein [Kitasatospora sp. NPDC018619]
MDAASRTLTAEVLVQPQGALRQANALLVPAAQVVPATTSLGQTVLT